MNFEQYNVFGLLGVTVFTSLYHRDSTFCFICLCLWHLHHIILLDIFLKDMVEGERKDRKTSLYGVPLTHKLKRQQLWNSFVIPKCLRWLTEYGIALWGPLLFDNLWASTGLYTPGALRWVVELKTYKVILNRISDFVKRNFLSLVYNMGICQEKSDTF